MCHVGKLEFKSFGAARLTADLLRSHAPEGLMKDDGMNQVMGNTTRWNFLKASKAHGGINRYST